MKGYLYRLCKKIIYKILYFKENMKNGASVSGRVVGIANVKFDSPAMTVPDGCVFMGNIAIGRRTTLGYRNMIAGNVTIGRYCQVGADVAMHATNHPVSYLTIYINTSLFDGQLNALKENKRIVIGNDVWIGHGAIIVGNVAVGNGVIIAAGSVVTKDIPDFAIVAGVPAKVVRFRFPENIQKEILELEWWNLTDEELEQNKHLFLKDFSTATTIYN